MGELKFSDGVKFNTDGELRVERRFDGYYVVGKGMLMPVGSYEEGQAFIKKTKEKKNV